MLFTSEFFTPSLFFFAVPLEAVFFFDAVAIVFRGVHTMNMPFWPLFNYGQKIAAGG